MNNEVKEIVQRTVAYVLLGILGAALVAFGVSLMVMLPIETTSYPDWAIAVSSILGCVATVGGGAVLFAIMFGKLIDEMRD